MSVLEYIAFAVPLVFIVVLWAQRAHYRAHPIAGLSLILLTVVAILHFDVGMVASDPYYEFLGDIGAPGWIRPASIVVLIVGAYSGELQDWLRPSAPRERRPRRRRSDTPG